MCFAFFLGDKEGALVVCHQPQGGNSLHDPRHALFTFVPLIVHLYNAPSISQSTIVAQFVTPVVLEAGTGTNRHLRSDIPVSYGETLFRSTGTQDLTETGRTKCDHVRLCSRALPFESTNHVGSHKLYFMELLARNSEVLCPSRERH